MKQHQKLVLSKVTFCYVTRSVCFSDIFTKEKPRPRAVSLQLEVWRGNNANQDDGRALLNVPTPARLCSLAFILTDFQVKERLLAV